MTPSDDLFRLVKSLTRSEKGYFKKFAARHVKSGENAYMTLFNAIDRQEQYDEEAIRHRYRNRAFIRRLPALKNYLYNLILRCLRSYYAESSAARRVRGLLDDYMTLSARRLYDQAWKVLVRARKLVEQYDMNHYNLILESYERHLHSVNFMVGTTVDAMEQSFTRELETLEELKRFSRLEAMNKRLFKQIAAQGTTRGAEPDWLREITGDPLLQDVGALRSLPARISFYQIHATCGYYTGDYEASYTAIRTLLHLLEERIGATGNYPDIYVTLLNNIVGICILLSRPDEAKQYLARLEALPARVYNSPVERFTVVRCQEILLYLKFGEFDHLGRLLPVLQRELAQFGEALPGYYRRYFAYYSGWAYFVAGERVRALDCINAVLNDRSVDVREDLYCFASILNLLLHYDLGNTELLRYEVVSVWRYLVRRRRTYRFETLLVSFIRKAVAARSDKALRREFIALRKELAALADDRLESRAFDYFHFIPWLDSRIEGIPLAEAVRRYMAER